MQELKEIHGENFCRLLFLPCYYGIDIPTHSELIASSHTIEEIRKYLRVDSIAYLSMDATHKSVEQDPENSNYCDACFKEKYPIAFDTSKHTIKDFVPGI